MPRNFLPLSHFPIPKRTSKFIQISSPDRSLGRRLALKIGKQGNASKRSGGGGDDAQLGENIFSL